MYLVDFGGVQAAAAAADGPGVGTTVVGTCVAAVWPACIAPSRSIHLVMRNMIEGYGQVWLHGTRAVQGRCHSCFRPLRSWCHRAVPGVRCAPAACTFSSITVCSLPPRKPHAPVHLPMLTIQTLHGVSSRWTRACHHPACQHLEQGSSCVSTSVRAWDRQSPQQLPPGEDARGRQQPRPASQAGSSHRGPAGAAGGGPNECSRCPGHPDSAGRCFGQVRLLPYGFTRGHACGQGSRHDSKVQRVEQPQAEPHGPWHWPAARSCHTQVALGLQA